MNIKSNYQLIYGYVLYTKEPICFTQRGENKKLNGLLINVKFGTIFTGDELKHQKIESIEEFLCISYACRTKKFTYSLHEEYKEEFEIVGYEVKLIEASGRSTIRQITKEEFTHLVQTYGNWFVSKHRLSPLTVDYRSV